MPDNPAPEKPVSDHPALRWVRMIFVDVFGGTHAVVLPAARYHQTLTEGVLFDGSSLEGRARHLERDMVLLADPASLTVLGQGVARVSCAVLDDRRRPWLGDPRTALGSIIDTLGDLAEEYRAAAELEFYLLDEDGRPIDRGDYYGDVEGPGMLVARAAADRLQSGGVEVVSAHLEAGPGQYELDLAPLGTLALADALVLAKQVVRHEAAARGLRATFMARPFSGLPGSGLHLHQQVGDRLFDARGELSAEGRAFVAGQLGHARGLCAFAAPNVNSYRRLHSGPEAPSHVVWGHANRAALVRLSVAYDGRPAAEVRLPDPAANPYLLLGALVASGADGIDQEAFLDAPFDEDLGGFDPAETTSAQLHPLPRDLDEALDALLADDVLVDAFDSRLLSRLVDGRRAEAEAYRAHVTSWEIDRYLEEA